MPTAPLKITVLVPENEFPAEGADPERELGDSPAASDLLDAYASVFGESSLAFRISPGGVVTLEETDPTERFAPFEIRADGGEAGFSPVENAVSISVDLAGAAESVEGALDSDGGLRQLVDRLSRGLRGGFGADGATPVPLVRWHGDEGGGIAQLLGIWLAEAEQLTAFGDGVGDQRIIFQAGDVEGHGLRESVAALAVLGVMLGGAAKAEAGFLFFKSKAEKVAEQRAKMEQQIHPHQAPAVIDRDVVAKARSGGTEVIVDISRQRAYLVAADGDILLDTPVSTARAGKYTPRGEFKITQRVRTGKTSTIYGCSLPYWMRLGESAIGLHVGDLPGHPASAGCVRLPAHVAPVLFDATRSGTTVKVVDSWQRDPGLIASR